MMILLNYYLLSQYILSFISYYRIYLLSLFISTILVIYFSNTVRQTNLVLRRCNWRSTSRPCGLWSRFRPCWDPQQIWPTNRVRPLLSTRWTRMAVPVRRVPNPNRRRARDAHHRRSADQQWTGTANLHEEDIQNYNKYMYIIFVAQCAIILPKLRR